MHNRPNFGMCLLCNSVASVDLFQYWRPQGHFAEPDDSPSGEQIFLACFGCDFRRFGGATSFAPSETYLASPRHMSRRVSCFGGSERPVGIQTGTLVH